MMRKEKNEYTKSLDELKHKVIDCVTTSVVDAITSNNWDHYFYMNSNVAWKYEYLKQVFYAMHDSGYMVHFMANKRTIENFERLSNPLASYHIFQGTMQRFCEHENRDLKKRIMIIADKFMSKTNAERPLHILTDAEQKQAKKDMRNCFMIGFLHRKELFDYLNNKEEVKDADMYILR
jgi:hypothetical protein